jgi:hypothetical protein
MKGETNMSWCDHCLGQRYDRARVLRVLRQARRDLARARPRDPAAAALSAAIQAVRTLDIPHVDVDDLESDAVVH